ncbi:MAG: NAD-dependent epimerase/dehydratase family protein [Pseudomonadota bacterium]
MAIANSNLKVALIGGGYTLQRLAQLLPEGSFVITSRSKERCASWAASGWCSAVVSLDQPETLASLFREYPQIDTVVDSVPPLRASEPILGVRNLVSAIGTTKIRRILYLSTTGVFGVRDGSLVDESTPPRPWNSQGQARLDSEECYRELAQAVSSIEFTALRLPAIYSADRGAIASLKAGTYTLVDDGSHWTNRIHVDDLAKVIKACIDHKSRLPEVLCVSDDTPVKAIDLVREVCNRHSLPLPPSIASAEAERRGAYTMLSNQRICNALMKRVLGVELRYRSFRDL